MGLVEAPSSWKIAKLVFFLKKKNLMRNQRKESEVTEPSR